MAFFDNLGKKASEATAKAMQKAQEISETAKLNSLISDEEKRISNTYCEIGKLYVSLYSSGEDENFSGMIADIADAEEKISSYKKQIQDIKGVQYCSACGAELPRGVAFCSTCGHSMTEDEDLVVISDIQENA